MGLFGNFWDKVKPEPKICKDCKHFGGYCGFISDAKSGKCEHPKNLTVDLVTGDSKHLKSCHELRFDSNAFGLCGTEGVWFEPKDGVKVDG